MTDLKTDQTLIRALERASSRTPSSEQVERQRISFVMGVLPENNDMTRDEVRQVLSRQKGETAA